MAIRNSRRVSRIRNFAIALVMLGFIIMYAGIYFHEHKIIMIIGLLIGAVLFVVSTLIYSYIGMLAINQIRVTCPSCQKETRMLGKVDLCMHCNEALTLDKELSGKDYNEWNNSLKKGK